MISLNYRDSRPIYEQIRDGLRKLIVTGALAADEKLPSVRALAAQLAINPNTIQRAYTELEQEGYICSLPKKGVYVTYEGAEDRTQENADLALIYDMRDRGIDKQTLMNWIEEVYGSHD